LVNYLALLGWSPDESTDIISLEEMVNRFSLKDVSLSAAIYDLTKLAWMNGHYIRTADIERIVKLAEDQARQKGWLKADNSEYFHKVVDLVRSRVRTVNELPDLAQYFFEEPEAYDEKGVNKYFRTAGSLEKLTAVLEVLSHTQSFTALHLEEATRLKAEALGMKAAELIHPTRLALSGRTMTPGLFEIIELLGRKTSADRISKAIKYINNMA
jgi:glutamyl-tRNA synthetase